MKSYVAFCLWSKATVVALHEIYIPFASPRVVRIAIAPPHPQFVLLAPHPIHEWGSAEIARVMANGYCLPSSHDVQMSVGRSGSHDVRACIPVRSRPRLLKM